MTENQPRLPGDPGLARAKPARLRLYDRPSRGLGTTVPLVLAMAVIVLALAMLYAFFTSSFSEADRSDAPPAARSATAIG